MRKLVLSLFLALSPAAAFAGQAANPVQAFSYGTAVGTESNPIYAAISTATPSTTGPRQAASPVELFSYGQRVGTQKNPLYINMGTALSGYMTSTSADAKYLALAGGSMTGDLWLKKGISIYFCGSDNSCANLYNSGGQTLTWYSSGGLSIQGGGGLKVGGSISSSYMAGTGNAFVCVNASGALYRSSTACN